MESMDYETNHPSTNEFQPAVPSWHKASVQAPSAPASSFDGNSVLTLLGETNMERGPPPSNNQSNCAATHIVMYQPRHNPTASLDNGPIKEHRACAWIACLFFNCICGVLALHYADETKRYKEAGMVSNLSLR